MSWFAFHHLQPEHYFFVLLKSALADADSGIFASAKILIASDAAVAFFAYFFQLQEKSLSAKRQNPK